LARPSKLTDALVAEICERIANGAYPAVAAQASGIGATTFYRWQAENEAFRESVKTAAAIAECESVGYVRAGEQGWQGSAWYLERRYPDRWAQDRKKKRVEMDLAKAKLAEMKTLEDLISKASASELDGIIARLLARARTD
jgi:hypothetical protein